MESVPANPPIKQVIASEHPADRVGETKTLYQVSGWSIFWRNFLAGAARSFGAIFIYLIFLGVIGYAYYIYLWPQLKPLLTQYATMMQTLQNPQKTTLDPTMIDQIINQIKK
jgi:hypothetical protein